MPHCLGSGLTCRLGLGGHRSLQLDGKTGILAAKQRFIISHATTGERKAASRPLILHFYSFHLDAPSGSGFVKNSLHGSGYALAVTEDLVEVLGSQDVPQCRLGQQSRGVVSVFHVGHRHGGIGDTVIDDGVH